MSLSLAITLNVLLDIALLGLLAYVMSRPARLAPHQGAAQLAAARGGPSLCVIATPVRTLRPELPRAA